MRYSFGLHENVHPTSSSTANLLLFHMVISRYWPMQVAFPAGGNAWVCNFTTLLRGYKISRSLSTLVHRRSNRAIASSMETFSSWPRCGRLGAPTVFGRHEGNSETTTARLGAVGRRERSAEERVAELHLRPFAWCQKLDRYSRMSCHS